MRIRTLTALHIARGTYQTALDDGNVPLRDTMRLGGAIVLPGSSVKGMLRSVFEAITPSCLLMHPKGALLRGLPEEMAHSGCQGDALCPACQVFGTLNARGRVGFTSFASREAVEVERKWVPFLKSPFADYPVRKEEYAELPSVYMPVRMDGIAFGNERLYYAVEEGYGTPPDIPKRDFFLRVVNTNPKRAIRFYGRKFYRHNISAPELRERGFGEWIEAIPAGAMFHGKLFLDGLNAVQWGALLVALGLSTAHPFAHRLGYAKPAYLGSIALDVDHFTARATLSDVGDMDHEQLVRAADVAIETFSPEQRAALTALGDILDADRQGPDWVEVDHMRTY